MTHTGTWCPQCGPDVLCDEDGCCCTCGANCVGDGVEQALALRAENERLRAALRSAADWLLSQRDLTVQEERLEQSIHRALNARGGT